MHDLNAVTRECLGQLQSMGISCGSFTVEMDTRSKRSWGSCRRYPDGSYLIRINDKLLQAQVPPESLKTTVLHELLHAATGCTGHRGQWAKLAKLVSARLGLSITPTAAWDAKGLDLQKDPDVKYRFLCTGCGKMAVRFRTCAFTRQYRRYRCTACGGRFIPATEIKKPPVGGSNSK